MSQASERRRKPRQKTARGTEPVWVILQNVPGRSGEVRAKVLDMSEHGLGIELPFWLRENDVLFVKGLHGHSTSANGRIKARVVRCASVEDSYHAGLHLEDVQSRIPETNVLGDDGVPDYYDILQVSPKADPETIHRVFRLLAQRYHPDNGTTGDETMFRVVAEAYKVLSDPEKRAAYDVNYQARRLLRWQIFDQDQATSGKAAEKTKRRGILDLLYTARRNQPGQPSMSLHELEELLGCPREHLEFTLWYLKENGLITRSDNARYSITAKGVDYTELEFPDREQKPDHLLPAPEPQPTPQ
ncbi:MAG TPA: DnaJ domain-containing protein [Bryobacteraceae bacterium]|nr:DnaJ domain-containing protein [Bryobacteraceae bacterium]